MRFRIHLWLPLLILSVVVSEVSLAGDYRTRIFSIGPRCSHVMVKLAPDGSKVGAAYYRAGQSFVQIDNKVYGGFEANGNYHPQVGFSPDGKNFWFTFCKGHQYYLQNNDKVWGGYSLVKYPQYSADGKSFTFKYLKNGSWYLMVDGKTYGGYKEIGPVTFPNGGGFGFAYNDNDAWYIRINQDRYGPFQSYEGPFFSLQGESYGFSFTKRGKNYAIIDDQVFGPYDRVEHWVHTPLGSLEAAFSEDNQIYLLTTNGESGPYDSLCPVGESKEDGTIGWGWKYRKNGKNYLRFGGKDYGGFPGEITGPSQISEKQWGFGYRQNQKYYIQIKDAKYGTFSNASGPYFDANGNVYAFTYEMNGQKYTRINHMVYRNKTTSNIEITRLLSNKDGSTVVYSYKKDGRDFVRADDMIYGGRGSIDLDSFALSNNGKVCAWRFNNGVKEFIQINEKVYLCDSLDSTDFVITPDNRVIYVALKNGKIIVQEYDFK